MYFNFVFSFGIHLLNELKVFNRIPHQMMMQQQDDYFGGGGGGVGANGRPSFYRRSILADGNASGNFEPQPDTVSKQVPPEYNPDFNNYRPQTYGPAIAQSGQHSHDPHRIAYGQQIPKEIKILIPQSNSWTHWRATFLTEKHPEKTFLKKINSAIVSDQVTSSIDLARLSQHRYVLQHKQKCLQYIP